MCTKVRKEQQPTIYDFASTSDINPPSRGDVAFATVRFENRDGVKILYSVILSRPFANSLLSISE